MKEGIVWKTISAINPLNGQKVLLNQEITKNPTKLITIPDFEDESTYFFNPKTEVKANPNAKEDDDKLDSDGLGIKLKEFLSTPTVLAIVYHSLRSSGDKIELNDHLALNILLLISKFSDSSEKVSPLDPSLVINYDSTVFDLISKMKRIIFGYIPDEDGNTNISNHLCIHNFRTLLNIKIGSYKLEPKSFVDILLTKGELGKSVLSQLSVEFEVTGNQPQKQSIKEINKKRANKLKQDIMSQYKTIISNYNMNNVDQVDEQTEPSEDTQDEVCSICVPVRQDQLLSYPLFIYRTKLPFIIDKPPIRTSLHFWRIQLTSKKTCLSSSSIQFRASQTALIQVRQRSCHASSS